MTSRYHDPTTLTRWLAVSRRDAAAHSSFLYGAKSTRIFCRPTCPGRLARRSNVVFFDSHHQALDAGYRACKRCQPCTRGWDRGIEGRTLACQSRDIIVKAEQDGRPWTFSSIARELNVTSAHLHRQFKRQFDTTPRSFAASLKLDAVMTDPSLLTPLGVNLESSLQGDMPASEEDIFLPLPSPSCSFIEAFDAAASAEACAHRFADEDALEVSADWELDLWQLLEVPQLAESFEP